MNSQLIVILLVGLAASTYALDLSHAKKRSIEEIDPRALDFLRDLYAKVVYPPLNHVVTSLALLGAQVLAGVSEKGIPAPGGRTLYPSEAQARGFFDDLWNNAIRPQLESALSGVALQAAGLLAGIAENGLGGLSIGKRDLTEAEMRGFSDVLDQAFTSLFHNVFKKPMEDALSSGALMLAQVLAGIGTNGVNLGNIIGKRDLADLAGRQDELRGFFDSLGQGILNGLQSVWHNIVKQPAEEALKTTALLGAQVLAGIGVNGIDLSAIMGKRELDAEGRGIFTDLLDHAGMLVKTQVKPTLEGLLNNAALNIAGVLANFSQNGFGRR